MKALVTLGAVLTIVCPLAGCGASAARDRACADNLRILTVTLDVVLSDDSEREQFFSSVSQGADPVVLLMAYAPRGCFVCPADAKLRGVRWHSRNPANAALAAGGPSYATWDWDAQTLGILERHGSSTPYIWDRTPAHEGRRTVISLDLQVTLMTEEEFREKTRPIWEEIRRLRDRAATEGDAREKN